MEEFKLLFILETSEFLGQASNNITANCPDNYVIVESSMLQPNLKRISDIELTIPVLSFPIADKDNIFIILIFPLYFL